MHTAAPVSFCSQATPFINIRVFKQQERQHGHKAIGLICNTIAIVLFTFWYSLAAVRCETATWKNVFLRTWAHGGKCFFPEFETFHSNRFPGEFTNIFQDRQIGIVTIKNYILTWCFCWPLRRHFLSLRVSFILTKGLQVSPSYGIVRKAANGELPSFFTEKNSAIRKLSISTTNLLVCKVLSDAKGSANLYGFSQSLFFVVSYQCSRARVRSLQRSGTLTVILNQFALLFTTIYLTR